jgi:pterin-4a-carbinolamine dehydratase
MQGMQQLFRQQALEKQGSIDGWQTTQSTIASKAHLAQHYGHHPRLNSRSVSEESQGDLSPTTGIASLS